MDTCAARRGPDPEHIAFKMSDREITTAPPKVVCRHLRDTSRILPTDDSSRCPFFHFLGLGSRRIAYNNMMAAGGNRQYAPPPFRILKIIRNEIWVDSVQK